MIKYVELTSPDSDSFRGVKIVSAKIKEQDVVRKGDILFVVEKKDGETLGLPATKGGRIVDLIAFEGDLISPMTPLLLLETETEPSVSDEQPTNSPAPPTEFYLAIENDEETQSHAEIVEQQQPSSSADGKQQQLDLDTAFNPTEETLGMSDKQTSNTTTIVQTVPDIGGDAANVIEIHVSSGDKIGMEDTIVTLESDKASMDVPSEFDGIVGRIFTAMGDQVSEGSQLIEVLVTSANRAETAPETISQAANKAPQEANKGENVSNASTPPSAAEDVTTNIAQGSQVMDVIIPDIGEDPAKVIEVLVEVGQTIAIEDPLITLESDKASMDVPSSVAGQLNSIEVAIGQEVVTGVVVAKIETLVSDENAKLEVSAQNTTVDTPAVRASATKSTPQPSSDANSSNAKATSSPLPSPSAYASPSVRRFARELGVDISLVVGSGRKSRILRDDVKAYIKNSLSSSEGTNQASPAPGQSGHGIPVVPAIDFSRFGDIDIQPLNRIKRLTATNLHRSWLNVPHVTHNDESNISDLETFRKQLNAEYAKQKSSIKLSPLAFIVKAMVNALQSFPQFNSSLDESGENLIYKKYFNIGIAVDTPDGLVVPVIKDADQLSVAEIATEMGDLATKARDKKLKISDMSGACITISSLGGLGGTHFTPIVNAPEVAILGVSRSKIQPLWDGSSFVPASILPLSLSYDHRVIDGAEAARFTRHLAVLLEDIRRLSI